MQKNFSLVLASAVTVLLAICLVQSFQISDQKQEITQLREIVSTNATQIKALQAAVTRMKVQKTSYSKEIRNLSEQNSNLASKKKQLEAERNKASEAANTNLQDNKNGLGDMLAEMLKDPEMKKAMEAQQRQIVKTMYGALFKDLKLTPEETDRFTELLLAQQMQNMDVATGFMSKDGDKADLTKKVTARQEETEAQLKELLGDERFTTYKDYTTTLPDRMALDQFKTQFSENALSDQQQQQLLQIMGEERKNMNLTDFSKAENFSQLASAGALEKMMEQQKAANERVYARATELLTPSQLQSFGAFQTNQLQMQQMGFKMAQKMWGSATNNAAE